MTGDEPNDTPKSTSAMLPLSVTGALKSAPIGGVRRFAGGTIELFSYAVRFPHCRIEDISNVEYQLPLAELLIGN